MKQSLMQNKRKYKTQREAVQAFWKLQSQWNGQSTNQYTVAQANAILRGILNDSKLSYSLKQCASKLQEAIIVRPKRKKYVMEQDISIVAFGARPIK